VFGFKSIVCSPFGSAMDQEDSVSGDLNEGATYLVYMLAKSSVVIFHSLFVEIE